MSPSPAADRPRPSPDCGGDPEALRQAAALTHVLVGGWVRHPLRLDAAALEARGGETLESFTVVCTFDGAHGGARPMRGTRLCPLIEAAEPAFVQRTDFKRVIVVAESVDGYRSIFSWGELFNTVVGDQVYLAYEHPQAPLPEGTGPFALVSLQDRVSGRGRLASAPHSNRATDLTCTPSARPGATSRAAAERAVSRASSTAGPTCTRAITTPG